METNSTQEPNSSTNDSSFSFDDMGIFKGNCQSTTNIVSRNKELMSENTKLKETVKDLRARLSLLESKYNQNSENLNDEIKNAKNETIESKKKLFNAVKNLESKLDDQSKLNSKLEKTNRELKTQIDSFLHSIQIKTKKPISNLTEVLNMYDVIYSLSESASDKIKNLEDENSSLMDQLDETATIAKNKEIESSKLKKKLKKVIKNQNQIDTDEIESIQKLHEKQMKEAQSVINSQNDQISQLKSQIAQLATSKEVPISQLDNTNFVSNEMYETNMNLLQNKLQMTEQILNNKDDEITSLQDTVDDLKEKCADLEHQLQESRFAAATSSDSYKALKEKSKQSKQTIQKLRDDLSAKETELAECDTSIHELQLRVSELEAEKQQITNSKNKQSDQISAQKECSIQYQETIKLYQDRFEDIDKLFESQSREIAELMAQRKSVISQLIQFNHLLSKSEAVDQELFKANKGLTEENNLLKGEIKVRQEREKNLFRKAVDECIEIVPKEVASSLQVDDRNITDYGSVLKSFVQALSDCHSSAIEKMQSEIQKDNSDELRKANKALLGHLQNSCKIIKSFANSSLIGAANIAFPITETANDSNDDDANPRTALLATCARLDKFIQDQKVDLPINEFMPSIFEPRELNDPQKVAQVFLEFVEPESFEKSPIAELFTLFMCVCQINQILIKNIDENKIVLQKATRASQNEAAFFQQVAELEKWKKEQSDLNDKIRPFLVKCIDHANDCEDPNLANFYDYKELVEKVVSSFDQSGEIPIGTPKEELIKRIVDLEGQIDILQKEIERAHQKQESDRQLFCRKANKIVDQVQKRLEINNQKHEKEKAELSNQLNETQKLLDSSKLSYENMLEKAQKKLQKKEDLINSLRSENENLSQRTTTIQDILSQSKSQADIDTDTINSLHKRIDDLKNQLELANNQKKLYKKKLEEIEENNVSILSNLRQRSEELSGKYENTISSLEKELKETRVALEKSRAEMSEVDQKKQELYLLNAKLKMMERTASLKLTAANEALDRERQASEMKQKSIALALKAENDAAIAENDKLISQAIEIFKRILNDEFDISPTSNCENFDIDDENFVESITANVDNKELLLSIMNDIKDALDTRKAHQFAINDSLRLRKLLNLNPKESLIDVFKSMEDESSKIKQEAEKIKLRSANVETASLRIMRDNKKLERASVELTEWINWSKVMLRNISDINSPGINQTNKEVRFALEEALLSSISQKAIRKKVEILRSEKKLLLSQKPLIVKTAAQLRVRDPVKSLAPLIISFNFIRKLQDMSGFLPAKFNVQ